VDLEVLWTPRERPAVDADQAFIAVQKLRELPAEVSRNAGDDYGLAHGERSITARPGVIVFEIVRRTAHAGEETMPRMSLAEWADLPEDEPGEWVDGRLEEEEVADYVHEVIAGWLLRVLGGWAGPRGGVTGGSDAKFAVSLRRGRKSDVTVYLPGSKLPPRRGLVRVPPSIAVEVVSPRPRDARRDRVDKSREYAVFGIKYYWIVDPELRSIEIFELGKDGRYVLAVTASNGKIRDVPGCRGLRLDLDAMWAEADRLPKT
jgi:Uma2 family endonuclease